MKRCPTCQQPWRNRDHVYRVTSDGLWLGFEYRDPERDMNAGPRFRDHHSEYCHSLTEAKAFARLYVLMGFSPVIFKSHGPERGFKPLPEYRATYNRASKIQLAAEAEERAAEKAAWKVTAP